MTCQVELQTPSYVIYCRCVCLFIHICLLAMTTTTSKQFTHFYENRKKFDDTIKKLQLNHKNVKEKIEND